ncbi:MAG TPA: AI-2E family transporter [Blastocatellia bacterium]|nr:AI-2E family transporter [Blastocatellia bacterium]
MLNQEKARLIFLFALGGITAWFCYLISKPFLKPAFIALVFAIVFYPLHVRIRRSIRNRNLGALLSTLFVLLIIMIPTVLLGITIRDELADVYQSLSAQSAQEGGLMPYLLHLSDRITAWVGRYVDVSRFDLKSEVVGRLRQISAFMLAQLAGAVGNLVTFAVDGAIAFFTLFFLFRDGQTVYRRIAVITPLRPSQVEKLSHDIGKTILASMYGGLAVALAQGLLTSLAFWILGLSSPILWGVAAAIFSFVPFIGSSAIWLPASIFLIVTGQWVKGVILLIWGAGVVGMADNVVRPYVISGHVNFHPLYIFFALLGGVQAFGLLGLFIGPVILAIAQALFGIIREEMRELNAVKQKEEVMIES